MKISTSILSCEDRASAVLKLNSTDTSYIHIDVMDGKFVSDIQLNDFEEIYQLYLLSEKPFDVHLMVNNPLEYLYKLSSLNVEFISFHVEIDGDIKKNIDYVHEMGYKVGLAIKPDSDIGLLEKYLDDIDMILVMSVQPGKGGQSFLEETSERIVNIKSLISDRDILIEIDGGINDKTISLVRDVDIAVSGSYIVNSDNYKERIDNLLKVQKC